MTGSSLSEQYPSGRVVKTEYDGAGRVAGVKGEAAGSYYAGGAASDATNRIRYAASGAASALRLGNGLWEHAIYNSRFQPTRIGLGTSSTSSGLLQLDYSYGTTDNNGNLLRQTITLPGAATAFVQSYGYDELNRVNSAEETINTTSTWKQVYAYDRYGNRTLGAGTTYPAQLDATNNPSISPANNRLTSAGYSHDAAGNLLCDPARQCVQGPSSLTPYYSYDAESRMRWAGGGYDSGGTTYSYDGEGRRVRKATAGGEVTVFVYDAAGRVVAEYSNRVERNGTSYVTQDHLGSTRVVMDANGAVKSRHDYLPFGEEIGAGVGGRATAQGYGEFDGVRQGFTGYEKDGETGLNYAKARYHSPIMGRFTSVDPMLASAKPANPQTWNRYVYALNRPTVAIDPDGLSTILVIVAARSNGGDGSASVLVLNRKAERESVGRSGTDHIPGLARGNGSDRTKSNADTPFGVYRIYRDARSDLVAGERGEKGERTGTQGGAADSNPRGAAFGTGIIYMEPAAGEVVDAGRSTIYFHGGGSALGDKAFDPDQTLVSTHGCIRLHNQDVNSLIGVVNQIDLDGDPVGQIFVGDAPYLNDLAGQRENGNGQYLYPDLRIALGLDQPPPEQPQQQQPQRRPQ